MNKHRKWFAILIAALLAVACASAAAENISTTVVMRVSRLTQSAIVNVGEDLSLEVGIEGVEPASYQWFFGDAAIPGADQRIYNIANAKVEDSGTYRLEAFDTAGSMVVSMDIGVRVIDNSLPKSGDDSLPVGVAIGAFALAGAAMALTLRRRRSV